jgi:4-oxalocrotonate tautomerase family enzyme
VRREYGFAPARKRYCVSRAAPIAKEREHRMPLIHVSGPPLTTEQKRDMARDLTEVAAKAYDRPAEHIIVTIQENPPENVAIGGTLVVDHRAAE